jgi:SAM-dependent methyltransferase
MEGEYAKCSQCGSYRYISLTTSEEDNLEYFQQEEHLDVPLDKSKLSLLRFAKRLDHLIYNRNWKSLRDLELEVLDLVHQNGTVLEVGFGNGKWLIERILDGIDAYGIDISEKVVERFRSKHARHASRVHQASMTKGPFSLIYANALIEHLDDPTTFLQRVFEELKFEGWLVLGLPIVSPENTNIPPEFDINFWKPCHRSIYTINGLHTLLSKCGFQNIILASYDMYSYRVMNAMLKNGNQWVHDFRTPSADIPGAPGLWDFVKLLFTAIYIRSTSVWARVLAQKCR